MGYDLGPGLRAPVPGAQSKGANLFWVPRGHQEHVPALKSTLVCPLFGPSPPPSSGQPPQACAAATASVHQRRVHAQLPRGRMLFVPFDLGETLVASHISSHYTSSARMPMAAP